MTRYAIALVAALLALSAGRVNAAPGAYNDCSLNVGQSPSNIVFPAVGKTGPTVPTGYISLQNNSTGGTPPDIWFSVLPGSTAATAAPSWHLLPSAGYVFNVTDNIPSAISVIASGAGGVLTCWFY